MRFASLLSFGRARATDGLAATETSSPIAPMRNPRIVSAPRTSRLVTDPVPPRTVWVLDEPECSLFDRYVYRHENGTLFHTLIWRNVLITAGYGIPYYLIAMEGDSPVGVCPLMRESGESSPAFSSLPGTPAAGVLASDAGAAELLIERARALAASHDAALRTRLFRPSVRGTRRAICHPLWLRTPVATLRRCIESAVKPASSVELTELVGASHRTAPDGLPATSAIAPRSTLTFVELVQALTCAKLRPQHARTRSQHGECAALWLADRRCAYVLGFFGPQGGGPAALQALFEVVRRAANMGVTNIVFPAEALPAMWIARTVAIGAADLAQEHIH